MREAGYWILSLLGWGMGVGRGNYWLPQISSGEFERPVFPQGFHFSSYGSKLNNVLTVALCLSCTI